MNGDFVARKQKIAFLIDVREKFVQSRPQVIGASVMPVTGPRYVNPSDPFDDRTYGAHNLVGRILDDARAATAALYPEARIPETPMTTEDPAAAKLDHLAEILDATNLAAEAKYEIIRIAMEYGSLRAQKAEPPRRNAIYDWDDIKRAEADADRQIYGSMFTPQREDE